MDWNVVFVEPVKMMLGKFAQFVPMFVGFLLILLVGWLVAVVLKKVLVKVLVFLKIDALSGKINLSQLLEKGGIRYTLSEIIGIIFYWIIIFVATATAINALGLTSVSTVMDRIILYVPNIVIAIFILILGLFLSSFLSSVIVAMSANAGISQANILGKIASTIVIVFSVMIALEQLNIAAAIINAVITIIFASMGLAFAIAFGLGSKDIAAKIISDLADKLKKK
ncbi:MAG: hypothetical protein Q7K21_08065 [Elusimicrobiota bacterium]|nr:hypothetical protein [Elusimicrobiota bacterium]